jgi:AraC-like DNA-binding protein
MLECLVFMRQSLDMIDDPFSHLLRLMRAQSVLSGGLIAGGGWAMSSPPNDQIKFWGVVRGRCWLIVEGENAPIRFEEGDVFLLLKPHTVVASSDLKTKPVDLHDVLRAREGAISRLGQGDDFFMVVGRVELDGESGKLLLGELPPFIHIRATSTQTDILRLLLTQLVRESQEELPGASMASAQLAQLIFIQVLRSHIETAGPVTAGWLRAVTDKRLAPAVRLMHDDPGRAWTLEELARAAAMSRATFASYFKNVAGLAPMTYLTQWRMHLARRALQDGQTSIGVLAESFGYASESAFSNAFKRVTGASPRSYRKALKAREIQRDST